MIRRLMLSLLWIGIGVLLIMFETRPIKEFNSSYPNTAIGVVRNVYSINDEANTTYVANVSYTIDGKVYGGSVGRTDESLVEGGQVILRYGSNPVDMELESNCPTVETFSYFFSVFCIVIGILVLFV